VNKTVYLVTSRSRPVRDPPETAARGADTRTSEQPAAPDTRRTPRPDHLTAARRAQARCPPDPPFRAIITTRQLSPHKRPDKRPQWWTARRVVPLGYLTPGHPT